MSRPKKQRSTKPEPKTFPVEMLDISKLDPLFNDELKNPNHLTADKLKLLSSAMEEYGFLQPVLVRETETGFQVLDGHHRLEAAKKAGFSQVQAVVLPETADFKAIGHAIGLNRLRGDFDITIAADLMGMMRDAADLDSSQISLLTGFTTKEVEALLESAVGVDEIVDDVAGAPDLDQEPKKVKPFVIEIQFDDKALFQKVKRALKKASGGSNDLAKGIVSALGLEE